MHVDEKEYRELLNELAHLRAQVTTLQAASTADVLERRAVNAGRTKLSGQVEAFMHTIDQPIRRTPGVPERRTRRTVFVAKHGDSPEVDEVTIDVARIRLRAELVVEEAFEFVEALWGNETTRPDLLRLKQTVIEHVRVTSLKVDLVKAADALADLDYVVEGARLTFGIDGGPVADEVHRSNMAKVGGPKDPVTGKHLKPAGWTPPDVAGVLRAQGWEG